MGRFVCGDQVDRSKLSQRIANRVIDHPKTGLTAFNVNNGYTHGHGRNRGREHLKTIGGDEGEVGAKFGEALGKAQLGSPSRSRHVHIAVATQTGDSMRHLVALCFNFSNGGAVVIFHHGRSSHQDGIQFGMIMKCGDGATEVAPICPRRSHNSHTKGHDLRRYSHEQTTVCACHMG